MFRSFLLTAFAYVNIQLYNVGRA